MLPCVFRDQSDDAVSVDAETGARTRIDVWLCTWPTTIVAAPPWLDRQVGPSPAIDPRTDCMDCPVRREERSR